MRMRIIHTMNAQYSKLIMCDKVPPQRTTAPPAFTGLELQFIDSQTVLYNFILSHALASEGLAEKLTEANTS